MQHDIRMMIAIPPDRRAAGFNRSRWTPVDAGETPFAARPPFRRLLLIQADILNRADFCANSAMGAGIGHRELLSLPECIRLEERMRQAALDFSR